MSTLLRIEAIKDLVQEAVDQGATSVEQIHKTIADLPFTVLEQRGLLDEAGAALRDTSQRSIGGVYEAIRRINREVGEIASHVLEAIDDQVKVQRAIGDRERAERALADRTAGRAIAEQQTEDGALAGAETVERALTEREPGSPDDPSAAGTPTAR